MTNIRDLLGQISAEQNQLKQTQFIAPRPQNARVRVRSRGLVYTFIPQPEDFEGWGIFQPISDREAKLIEEADFFQISEYLEALPQLRVWLADRLSGKTWLAYPTNESDAQQRFSVAKPVIVRLVTEADRFDTAIIRYDGCSWWFHEVDRRADPEASEQLQAAFTNIVDPQELRFKGMTPEMKIAYELGIQRTLAYREKMQQQRDERRLKTALERGGGQLQGVRDRDGYWLVEWTTASGDRHTSAISKDDLTVNSAGICLSGRDRDFDLQSLVGVVEDG